MENLALVFGVFGIVLTVLFAVRRAVIKRVQKSQLEDFERKLKRLESEATYRIAGLIVDWLKVNASPEEFCKFEKMAEVKEAAREISVHANVAKNEIELLKQFFAKRFAPVSRLELTYHLHVGEILEARLSLWASGFKSATINGLMAYATSVPPKAAKS